MRSLTSLSTIRDLVSLHISGNVCGGKTNSNEETHRHLFFFCRRFEVETHARRERERPILQRCSRRHEVTVNAARRVFHGFCSSSRQRGHRRPLTPRLQFNLEQLNATARCTGSGRKLCQRRRIRIRPSTFTRIRQRIPGLHLPACLSPPPIWWLV